MIVRALSILAAMTTLAAANAQTEKSEDFFTGREVFRVIAVKSKQGEWRKLPMGELVG